MTAEEPRKRILARRDRFIAVAVASAGLATAGHGCGLGSPQVCLSQPYYGDAGDEAADATDGADAAEDGPVACLQPATDAPPPEDDGSTGGPEACLAPEQDA